MRRIGVIRNPRSERNKTQRRRHADVARLHSDVLYAELKEISAVSQIVAEFARSGVDLIVIDGGDGTVQAVLTEVLHGGAFSVLPKFAVIASGMTNLIAADVGMQGRRRHAFWRLVDAYATGAPMHVMQRRVLRMDLKPSATVPDSRTEFGMFFGAAALYHVTQFTIRHIHSAGIKHGAGVAAALAVAAGRLLGGGDEWRRGECIDLAIDGAKVEQQRHFLFLATTLCRLVLGLRPFWDGGTGPVRFLDIAAPPHRLARALVPAMLGHPRPWMASDGYRSGRADRLTLVLQSPFMLDGEVFEPISEQIVALSAGPMVEFVRP